MVKVSVVIPVYNVENYLEECLDSIINQTLKDIELICINDGSTDASIDILEKYAKADSRIQIFNQNNSGLSASRNRGIELSKGEFVYFIDSDDYLDLNALKELYDLSVKYDPDFIIFKLINFDDGTDEFYESDYYEMDCLKDYRNKLFNYRDVGDKIADVAVTAQGKFFKKEVISDIRFPEGLIFEDNLFFWKALLKSEKIFYLDKHLYYHRVRQNSITTTSTIKFADSIQIINKIIDLLKENGVYNIFKREFIEMKMKSAHSRFEAVREEDKKEFYKLLKDDFQKHIDEYEHDDVFINEVSFRSKLIFNTLLESRSYKEFLYAVKIYDSKKRISYFEKENSNLDKEIDYLRKSNNEILNSKGWRYTRIFRMPRIWLKSR